MKLFMLLLVLVPMSSASPESSVALDDILGQFDAGREPIRHQRSPISTGPTQLSAADQISYRPYSQVPNQIKDLLRYQQAREPITNIPAQPPPQLSRDPSAGHQAAQYRPQIQYNSAPQQAPQQQAQPLPAPVQYRAPQPQAQAPSQPQYNQGQQQAQYNPQYRRVEQPQAQGLFTAQHRYSPQQTPPQLQQLLRAQSQQPNTVSYGQQQQQQGG